MRFVFLFVVLLIVPAFCVCYLIVDLLIDFVVWVMVVGIACELLFKNCYCFSCWFL